MEEEIMIEQDQTVEEQPVEEQEVRQGYVPRPAWQVWAARVGVVIMIVSFLLYCYHIATGGR